MSKLLEFFFESEKPITRLRLCGWLLGKAGQFHQSTSATIDKELLTDKEYRDNIKQEGNNIKQEGKIQERIELLVHDSCQELSRICRL